MIDELLVSATPFGVRTALMDNGEVVSFHAESNCTPSLLGNIYLAAPKRSSAAARFLAIGKKQNALLQDTGAEAVEGTSIVQVTRAGWAGKAPRVSVQPALAGRYVVLFPIGTGSSVARRIKSTKKRDQLLALAGKLSESHGGGITIRTAAEDADETSIRTEAERHRRNWLDIVEAASVAQAPTLLAHGPDLTERHIRDTLPSSAQIITDDGEMKERLSSYATKWAPEFKNRIQLTDGALFERHDAAEAMARALQPETPLDRGGRLTIEPTAALTAIDIDCGVRPGAKRNALRTASLEAASTVAREIRRRNIAGLIVIDFPRQESAESRRALMAEMRRQMKEDTVAHKVIGISESGLMEITRQRNEIPLLDALTETCSGAYAGRRPRLDALAFDIAYEARLRVQAGARTITLLTEPELASYLRSFNGEAGRDEYSTLGVWLGVRFSIREVPERRCKGWVIESE